jgi:Mitochondrial inner membrane protein
MTDQDPTSRTTSDSAPATPAATEPAAVAEGAGDAGGGPAATGSPETTASPATTSGRATWLSAAALGALVLSALSLAVAITGPLWSPTIYGNPDAAQSSARFMVLGVAQLRPAIESNEPFRNQLTLVRGVMPSQPEVNQALETLAAYADKGVPTLPELQASFLDSANAIVLQEVVGTEPGGIERAVISAAAAVHLHAFAHWLGGTWPTLGETWPTSEVVWEAKTRLDTGDLAGASAALGKLTGPEAKVAERWIQAAQSRLAANQVLELLETVARSQAAMSAQRS